MVKYKNPSPSETAYLRERIGSIRYHLQGALDRGVDKFRPELRISKGGKFVGDEADKLEIAFIKLQKAAVLLGEADNLIMEFNPEAILAAVDNEIKNAQKYTPNHPNTIEHVKKLEAKRAKVAAWVDKENARRKK